MLKVICALMLVFSLSPTIASAGKAATDSSGQTSALTASSDSDSEAKAASKNSSKQAGKAKDDSKNDADTDVASAKKGATANSNVSDEDSSGTSSKNENASEGKSSSENENASADDSGENEISSENENTPSKKSGIENENSNKNSNENVNDSDEPEESDEPEPFSGSLRASDADVSVSVSVSADANLPEDAELVVSEIPEGSEEYDEYFDKLLDSLDGESDYMDIEARFFDIEVVSDGAAVEPEAEVDVEISSPDVDAYHNVAHFVGEDGEVEKVEAEADDGLITFSTESFSVYSLYRYNQSGMTDNLDGQQLIIANVADSRDYAGLVTSAARSPGLAALKGYIRFHRIVFESGGLLPEVWTFHAVTEPNPSIGVTDAIFNDPANAGILYTISAEVGGSTKYLKLAASSASVANTPTAYRVIAGTGNNEGRVMIQFPKGSSTEAYRLNLKSGDVTKYFQGSNWTPINENDWYTLFKAEDVEIIAENEQNFANKISVSNLQDGDEIVIYHSEWDPSTESYVQLAINGSGDLVLLTDEGGTVGWYTQTLADTGELVSSVKWRFTVGYNGDGSPSGYYWLQNVDTGAYLSPRGLYDDDGVKIADLILPGEDEYGEPIVPGSAASFDYSVQLPGRGEGEFTSAIAAWNRYDGTQGLRIDEDGDDIFGYKVLRGLYGDADLFDFAVVIEEQELTTKSTVDSENLGIELTLFDYSGRTYMSNELGSNVLTSISDNQRTWFVPGLVEPVLDADGLPVSASNGNSLTGLFDPADGLSANHLFLESVYNETGYMEYNSAQNYAYYNQTGPNAGDFTVYNQLGAPAGNSPLNRSHGHFMPFSQILDDVWTEKNTVDIFRQPLPIDNPRYGDDVHKIETAPSLPSGYDYAFGMVVETNFLQTLTKQDIYGNDSILEFSGDDDLWVFIDNVLVLDLGGIHSAVSGKINFSTGDITYTGFIPRDKDNPSAAAPYPPATIKECFQEAGVFPDGTTWDSSATQADIDRYFDGNTLKSNYRGHSMKMFYLERGANASNLHTRFNLRTIRTDSVLVGKEVSGTRKQAYMTEKFAFQAFLADGTPLDSAAKATLGSNGYWSKLDEAVSFETITVGNETYDNVFFLAHGEGAYFNIDKDDEYYVKEIAIDPDLIGSVTVNDELVSANSENASEEENDGDASLVDIVSSVETANERREITFDNEVVPQKLRITKSLDLLPGQAADPNLEFQFQVYVGADENTLHYYSVQPYYIKTMVGNVEHYCYRVDGHIVPLDRYADGRYYYTVGGVETVIPNKDATDPVFDYSSQNGYIDYVPAGYTIEIQGMLPGMAFSVEETNIPQGYELESIEDGGNPSFDCLSSPGASVISGIMTAGSNAQVVVTNQYHQGTFRLQKVSSQDDSTHLAGAAFELYNAPPRHTPTGFRFGATNLVARFTSDADGFLRVAVEDYYGGEVGTADIVLAAGTYYLLETQAPLGYSLEHPVSSFYIDNDGELHINGLVEWDDVNQEITYTSQDNLSIGEDTVIDMVVLQTGMISNVPASPLELPATGLEGNLGWIGLFVSLLALRNLLSARRRRRRFKSA